MIDRNRALQLLGTGLGPTDVGLTLGCDPSYISQLLMEDQFRTDVLELRMKNLQAATERDGKIDSLEDTIINKLKESLPYATKLRDILGAFSVLNAAKRRGARTVGSMEGQQKIVALILPIVAKQVFITNGRGEVVQVGEQIGRAHV